VLITLQSHEEVLNTLRSNPPSSSPDHKIPVLSISPQTIASLAATIRVTSASSSIAKLPALEDILARVKAFALELGFSYVFDTTFSRHLALREHLKEFQERSDAARQKTESGAALPMLASACPGWVCYAEKAHAEMLPFISTTKSPQQIMGTLVKEWIGPKLGKTLVHSLYRV
jgi:iron only hydrogenase large subunit-like protein